MRKQRRTVVCLALLGALTTPVPAGAAFCVRSLESSTPRRVNKGRGSSIVRRFEPNNDETPTTEKRRSKGSGLAISGVYESEMGKLSEGERYNLLLQGRCSNFVEAFRKPRGSKTASASGDFEPVLALLGEMTQKGIKLSNKSFASLMDAASLSKDLQVVYRSLTLAKKNGACRVFSRDTAAISLPPRDGRALQALAEIPQDDRAKEVGAGITALTVIGGSLAYEGIAPVFGADTTPATIILVLAAAAGVYDATKRNGDFVKLVLAGLNRLFLRDPEREARVQAATFLVAYLLGLPCFCYSPNVLEAVRMSDVEEFRDIMSSTAGLNRLLVYLLAPVAAEQGRHLQLIVSDPRQARALVRIFNERNPEAAVEDERPLQWAFAEAKKVLSANGKLLDQLQQRMEAGGATVGDCVNVLELQGIGGVGR